MLAWPSKTCFTRPATRQTQVSYVGSRRTAVMERGMWERSFSSWRNPVVRIFWMIGSCAAVSPGSRRWKQSAARLRVDFLKLVSTNVCRSPPSSQRAESHILDDVRAAPQEVPLTLRRLKCYVASLEWLLEELQFLGISQPTRRLPLTWHLGVKLQSLMGFLATPSLFRILWLHIGLSLFSHMVVPTQWKLTYLPPPPRGCLYPT